MHTLCSGCMKQKSNHPVCEHCGHDERQQNLPHQLPVGTLLQGQYLVGKVLGQGGFGITYIGWDQHLSVPVAIKEYFPSGIVQRNCQWGLNVYCVNGEAPELFEKHKARFMKEARILAQLSYHPQIVQVKNYFSANGTAYIVMEFVDGITLKSYLKQQGRPMTPAEAVEIMGPVLDALEEVHKENLIHRDISPDNIMLPVSGGVKLIDFGTVRNLEGSHSRSTESALKPGFAPLEQYNSNGNVGPWTDVYALCATFHYLMTGKLPPDAPTRIEAGEMLPLLDQIPGISRSLVRTLHNGMTIRTMDRIQTVQELRRQLYKSTVKEKVKPQIPQKKTGLRLKWAITAGAALCLAFCVMMLPEGVQRATAELPDPTYTVTQPQMDVPEQTLAPEIPQEDNAVYADWVFNVLRTDNAAANGSDYSSLKVYDTTIYRHQIQSITFLDHIPERDFYHDFSAKRDGSVVGWMEGGPRYYDLYIAGEGGINASGECCAGLFQGYTNVESISFGSGFHTDHATSFRKMFQGCRNLESLDISGFSSGFVTDMSSMFNDCKKLISLDLSHLDTSNVKDMRNLFSWCCALQEIQMGTWNTSKVTNMYNMFAQCHNLRELDLSGFETENVKHFNMMFSSCYGLTELDLSMLDTSAATTMYGMFHFCSMLKTVDLKNWDTSNVVDMSCMFASCRSLEALDLSHFDTSCVTKMGKMFDDCVSLQELQLGDWETESVTEVFDFYPGNELPDGTTWTTLFW